MSKTYKIVTSQVNADSSNDNSITDIKPYGEARFSVGNNDKLELLIFDGVRTALRSKVLNKGTFYGGDADSSDGLRYDTIKLIPDAVLNYDAGNYSNDQYLIIDPTIGEPGHIHIRAGGTIDSSSADLFLGGEKNYVRVSDTNDRVVISADNGEGLYTWIFSADSSLTLPGQEDGTPVIDFFEGATGNHQVRLSNDWTVNIEARALGANEGHLNLIAGQNTRVDINGAGSNVEIITGDGESTNTWTFGTDGSLTLPVGGDIVDSTGTSVLGSGGIPLAGATYNLNANAGLAINTTDGGIDLLRNGVTGIGIRAEGLHIYAANSYILWDGSVLKLPGGSDIQQDDGTGNFVSVLGGSVSSLVNGTSTVSLSSTGTLTLPNGATIVDTTTTMILTPNSPAQVTSLVLRSTFNSYLTADYPNSQSFQQYLHELDPVTYPSDSVSTGTEGTVIAITLVDSNGLQYVQGDVEYVITGTGITAADFTPAVLTGTFLAANWIQDGIGYSYTNTNMLMIADDAIVEGQETFTLTIITTGTYGDYAGSNYIRVNIADGTTEGSESGHIHLISENMAQTSIFLGNDDKYVKVAADDQIYIKVPNADTSGTSQLWTFGTDGSTTLPIGVSIDYNGNVQYPRIIADSGKLFSVQGQGNSGSAALAWTTDPNAAGQYAAVAVTRAGGGNLATVVLQAQSDSGDVGTVKLWRFDETGVFTLPTGSVIEDTASYIKLTPAGGTTATQALLIYPTAFDGNHIHLAAPFNSGTELYLGNDSHYVKLVNTGSVEVRAFDGLGANPTWTFGTNGSLTFPDNTVQTTAFTIGTAPLSSTSTGTAGTIALDASYLYVCTATNSWQRVSWDLTPW